MTNVRRPLLASVALAALGIAHPACAQGQGSAATVPPVAADAATKTAVSQDAVAPQATEAVSNIDPADIIVTARRRAERLQDVPLSVTAIDAAMIERQAVLRTEDLQLTTPTLRVVPQSNGRNSPVFELRGINTFDVLATQDPAVAVYRNEVYLARPIGVNQPLVDIESVQVLLGPQGTLFGRNSTAGAVLFTTKKPTDIVEGEVGATIGNYGRFDYEGVLNLPVTGDFALRFVGTRVKRNGYTRDIVTGRDYDDEDSWSGRVSARFKSSTFENNLVVDYFNANENGTTTILDSARPGVGASLIYPSYQSYLAAQKARGPRRVAYDFTPFNRAKAWGLSNVTTLAVNDAITLKNIAGYRWSDATNAFDGDSSPFQSLGTRVRNYGHQYSDELQAQGSLFGKQLDYIVGAYFFTEDASYNAGSQQRTSIAVPLRRSVTNTHATNESESLFAQVTYRPNFFRGFSITGGIRHTWDQRYVSYDSPTLGLVSDPNPPCSLAFIPAGQPCYFSNRTNFSQPSWTIGADYKLDRDKLIYIVSRRGYRSGGFNSRVQTIGQTIPFNPETVTDVEVGFKADWHLGGSARLRTNIAVYQNNYDDIQRNVGIIYQGVSTTTIVNAAKAKIRGFELNVGLRPIRGLELNGFWGYVDAVHKEFSTVVSGTPTVLRDVPFGVPSNTYGINGTVTPMDGANGVISLTGTVSYVGGGASTQGLPFLEPEGFYPGYTVANMVVDWKKIFGSSISAQIWVRNLLDKDYVVSSQSLQAQYGFTAKTYGAPRMVGALLKYEFGR